MIRNYLLALSLCICNLSYSQTIDDFLDSYDGENSIPYLQPLADLFTANLHSGIREWSAIDSGFHVRLTLVGMTSFPSQSQKTFIGKTDSDFEPEQTATAPTIIGSTEPVTVQGLNGTAYVFPGGYNLRNLPFLAPQITIGGIYHTEICARYFAINLHNDLGKVSLLGIGLRHGLNSYFPKIPFDLSIAYFFHNFKNDPYIDSKLHLASAYLGKSGKWWSSHIMLGYQTSTTKIRYSFTTNEEVKNVSIDLNNKYSFVAELSGAIKLWIITVHGALTYSGPITATAGIGLRF